MTARTTPEPSVSRRLLIGFMMFLAAGLAIALTPKTRSADQAPRIDLQAMVPLQFGDWRLDDTLAPLQVSPDVKATLDKIYSQTLSRTYINRRGERVMLSIAYGGDQGDAMKAHRPEVCYPAQGFQILHQSLGDIQLPDRMVTVKRLVAKQGPRVEPITYWFVTGNKVGTSNLERKLAQIQYGLTGSIPDGMLFRMSTIGPDQDLAFALHARFVADLLASVSPETRTRLVGSPGPA